MAMSTFSKSSAALNLSVRNNSSPLPFVPKVKKLDKVDGTDSDKTEWIKLEFLMDPDNPASNSCQNFAIFKDGFPEEWIKWLMVLHEIKNLIPLTKPADKTRMI
jgi:hypothetical protein